MVPAKLLAKKKKGPPRWEKEEDDRLKSTVQELGFDWEKVAPLFPLRTPHQCASRWNRVLSPNIHRGAWTPQEDEHLLQLVAKHGTKKWSEIARQMENRIGKQCRERWINQLNPTINKNPWTPSEDEFVCNYICKYGTQWAKLAKLIPGRTDNAIKNRWNSTLRKYEKAEIKRKRGKPPSKSKIFVVPGVKKGNKKVGVGEESAGSVSGDSTTEQKEEQTANGSGTIVKKNKGKEPNYTPGDQVTLIIVEDGKEIPVKKEPEVYAKSPIASLSPMKILPRTPTNCASSPVFMRLRESLGSRFKITASPVTILKNDSDNHLRKIKSPNIIGSWNLNQVIERKKLDPVYTRISPQTPTSTRTLSQSKVMADSLNNTKKALFTAAVSSFKVEQEQRSHRKAENVDGDPWLTTPGKSSNGGDSLSPSQFASYYDNNGSLQRTPDNTTLKRGSSTILETPTAPPNSFGQLLAAIGSPMKTPSPLKKALEDVRTSQSLSSPFLQEDIDGIINKHSPFSYLPPGIIPGFSPTTEYLRKLTPKKQPAFKRKILFDAEVENINKWSFDKKGEEMAKDEKREDPVEPPRKPYRSHIEAIPVDDRPLLKRPKLVLKARPGQTTAGIEAPGVNITGEPERVFTTL